jgi:hypothetical protein
MMLAVALTVFSAPALADGIFRPPPRIGLPPLGGPPLTLPDQAIGPLNPNCGIYLPGSFAEKRCLEECQPRPGISNATPESDRCRPKGGSGR